MQKLQKLQKVAKVQNKAKDKAYTSSRTPFSRCGEDDVQKWQKLQNLQKAKVAKIATAAKHAKVQNKQNTSHMQAPGHMSLELEINICKS